MTIILAIARREWASFFRVPLGWLAVAAFSLVASWLFLRGVLVPGQPASMRPLFATMGWLLLPLAPAVTMRLISEETRSGTIEPLQTSPVSDYAVILGKFLGGLAFLLVLLLPTLLLSGVLWWAAEPPPAPSPDAGPVLTGLLSFTLLASLFLSVGLLISTLTSNQTLAFLGALMAILATLLGPDLAVQSLAALDSGPDAATDRWTPLALTLTKALRVGVRLEDFARGVIDTGHVVAFLAWSVFFLVAAAVSLESRRWRSLRSPRRAARLGGFSLVLFLATLLSAALATTLGDRFATRLDATRTGEHQLTPRTTELLRGMTTDAEIIIAADWLAMDRRTREDLSDVLGQFADASPAVTTRAIDFAAQAGRADYAALLRESLAREQPAFTAAGAVIAEALRVLPPLGAELGTTVLPSIETTLAGVPDSTGSLAPLAERIRQAAEGTRASLRTLSQAESAAATLLSRAIEGTPVPALDEAAAALLAALDTTAQRAIALEAELKSLASAQPRSGPSVRAAADAVRASRERLDTAAEPLRRLPTLDTLTIAGAVGRSSALLVRVAQPASPGRGTVRAVPLARVVRTSESDVRRRAESEIAAALAAATNPQPPIVVFLSADPAIASGVRVYDQAVRRIAHAGGDALSWDLIDSPTPPSLSRLNPSGTRPVVYVVRMPDQTQAAFGQIASGIVRAALIAEAAAALADQGAPVLVCVAPAVLPNAKQPEAADRLLAPFGLRSRSDAVILSEPRTPQAAPIEFSHAARPIAGTREEGHTHAFADAAAGTTLVLPWATTVEQSATGGPSELLFEIGGPQSWRESRWIELRRSLAEGRWPTRIPTFDAAEDQPAPAAAVIALGQRPSGNKTARLVVIGSAEWLDDSLLARQRTVDGRAVQAAGGNLELFDAAVSWLAGQESRSIAGAGTRSVAMVAPLSSGGRARLMPTLRWALLAGMPLGVLALGILWRLWRG